MRGVTQTTLIALLFAVPAFGQAKPTDDLREARDRPDLVTLEHLVEVADAPPVLGTAAFPFDKVLAQTVPALVKTVFGHVVTAFDPPIALRVVVKQIQVRLVPHGLRVTIEVSAFDARDRARVFRDRDTGFGMVEDLDDTAAVQTALQTGLRGALDELALRFLSRMGAPAPPKPHHVLHAGLQGGGALAFGASVLVRVTRHWSIQAMVDPLYPRVAAAVGALNRVYGQASFGLWLHAGLAHEWGIALASQCAPRLCADQQIPRTFAYGRVELAESLGDEDQHRIGVDIGVHLGVVHPTAATPAQVLARPYGGISWHYGF